LHNVKIQDVVQSLFQTGHILALLMSWPYRGHTSWNGPCQGDRSV